MKRLLIFVALVVAIGAGGNILAAHAQTATTQTLSPAQVAQLQQELAVAKATLANLEMEAGNVPPADAGTPSTIPPSIAGTGVTAPVAVVTPTTSSASGELTAAQIVTFKATLGTLATTLTQLAASISANTTLAPSQQLAVQATLTGMQNTLVAMANTVAAANNAPVASAPVAMTQPSAPVAVNTAPAAGTGSTGSAAVTAQVPATQPAAPTVAVNTAPTTPAMNNPVPQTAQASSIWSFTKAHWPTIVIVLLVIAILAILFWPEKETVKTVSTGTSGSGKPKSAPITTVTMNQQTNSNPPRPMNNVPSPATPVANAVAAPSQK